MSLPIRIQRFTVTIAASVMPPMTETELWDAVAELANEKERQRGFGTLSVSVREVDDFDER